MSMEIATRPAAAASPVSEWLLMNRQAEALAQSSIIPQAYRRQPANILVAALTGRTFGWDALTAIRMGHVIEGTYSLKPEAMLALVRRAGHSVTIEHGDGAVTARGKRFDTGDEMTMTFTLEDARRAGLANKQTWKQYPQSMLQWRVVANLCRSLFGDVTLGLYSAEELGAGFDADGELVEAEVDHGPQEPIALGAEAMSKFVEACEQNDLDPSEVMRRAFPDRELDDPVLDTELPHLRDTFRAMTEERGGADRTYDRHDEIAGGTEGAGDSVPSDPDSVRPASRGQVGLIKAAYERMAYDRDAQLAATADVIGRTIGSHNELTADEAGKMLDYLNGLEP